MANKIIALTLFLSGISTSAFADKYVNGYTKKDGTYVEPYYRTDPNNTRLDNYSSRGNIDPYTGKPGTKDPNSYEPNLNGHEDGHDDGHD